MYFLSVRKNFCFEDFGSPRDISVGRRCGWRLWPSPPSRRRNCRPHLPIFSPFFPELPSRFLNESNLFNHLEKSINTINISNVKSVSRKKIKSLQNNLSIDVIEPSCLDVLYNVTMSQCPTPLLVLCF